MQLSNPRIEPLAEGGTELTWEVHLQADREVYQQELRFAVRVSPAMVERLLAELGPERVVSLLWTHFRSIPSTQASLDSEHASFEEWAQGVEALLAEAHNAAVLRSDAQASR
jgi:hypothetical protein